MHENQHDTQNPTMFLAGKPWQKEVLVVVGQKRKSKNKSTKTNVSKTTQYKKIIFLTIV